MSKTPGKIWRERFVKTSLDLVILGLLEEKERWGYEINMQIKDKFEVYLSAGTLYPLLHELEKKGFIEGIWEADKGRGRRIYRISPKGKEFLINGEKSLDDFLKRIRIWQEPPRP